jgi:hypothetical protein
MLDGKKSCLNFLRVTNNDGLVIVEGSAPSEAGKEAALV